jgi:glycosyltransferase involved in cell wall biosynthesis
MNGQGDIRQVVTVCITAYNREDLLPFAIQSVLDQTYANLEILVVDDCSNDGTSDVVAEFMKKDERIKYVLHEQNKGLAAARNTAIFKAKGRYFTFLDDDDEWTPEFVEKFVAIAQQYGPDYVFCCGHVEYDRSGRRINLIPHYYGKLTDAIRRGNVPPPSSQFYFTEELKKIGGYNEQIMSGVDHDLWLTLAFHGYRVKALEEALTVINPRAARSDNRMTTDWQRRFNGVLASLEIWRPNIVKHFGEAFFEHFKMDYLFFTYKSFFVASLKRKDLRKACFFFWRCPNKTGVLASLWRSFVGRTCRALSISSAFEVRTEEHQFRPFRRR